MNKCQREHSPTTMYRCMATGIIANSRGKRYAFKTLLRHRCKQCGLAGKL